MLKHTTGTNERGSHTHTTIENESTEEKFSLVLFKDCCCCFHFVSKSIFSSSLTLNTSHWARYIEIRKAAQMEWVFVSSRPKKKKQRNMMIRREFTQTDRYETHSAWISYEWIFWSFCWDICAIRPTAIKSKIVIFTRSYFSLACVRLRFSYAIISSVFCPLMLLRTNQKCQGWNTFHFNATIQEWEKFFFKIENGQVVCICCLKPIFACHNRFRY